MMKCRKIFLQSTETLLRRSIMMKYREIFTINTIKYGEIFTIFRDLVKKEHFDEVQGDFLQSLEILFKEEHYDEGQGDFLQSQKSC